MPHENPSFNNGAWGQPEAQQSITSRFREALRNPALRDQAQRIGHEVGSEAVKGALEYAGVAKFDDEGNMKVRKFGAVKAVLRPGHTARKAAMGAVEGARTSAKEQAVGLARQKVDELYGGAQPSTPEATVGWAVAPAPETVSTGGWGVAPNTVPAGGWAQPAEALPADWNYSNQALALPAEQVAADSWARAASEQTAQAQSTWGAPTQPR